MTQTRTSPPVLDVIRYVGAWTRAVMRAHYRLIRLTVHRLDQLVMPAFFDEGAPTKLAYEHFLIRCDRIAASVLHDQSAAARAALLRERSAAVRYAIARRQHDIQCVTDDVLERHRQRFRRRQQQYRVTPET